MASGSRSACKNVWNRTIPKPKPVITSENLTPLQTDVFNKPKYENIKVEEAEVKPEDDVKTKRKKKKLPKAERQKRKEEAKLKSIYGPKDSHIHLISPAMLENMSKSSTKDCTSSQRSVQKYNLLPTDFPSIHPQTENKPLTTSPGFDDEFPSLGVQNVTKTKSTCVPRTIVPCKGQADDESGWETEVEKPEVLEKETTYAVKVVSTSDIPPEEIPTSSKKKSKNPLIVTLDALIQTKDVHLKRRDVKKTKLLKKEVKNLEKNTVGNTLDSSGPMLIRRGKMRDQPRKKKVSALKKAILVSRCLRQSKRSKATDVKDVQLSTELKLEKLEISTKDTSQPHGSTGTSNIVLETADNKQLIVKQLSKHNISGKDVPAESVAVDVKKEPQEILETKPADLIKDENIFATLLNAAIKDQQKEPSPTAIVVPVITETPIVANDVILQAKTFLHSRKFRPYCNMYLSKELHGHVICLMKELHRFQDRLYHTDPIKYQSKRRYVHGLKDTINYLEINKVALVILAPDMEENNVKGGLEDKISTIITQTTKKNVPLIFSGNRFILGKSILVKSQVSAIAVLDKQGAEDLFNTVVNEAAKLRQRYENDLKDKIEYLIKQSAVGGDVNAN